MQTVTITIDYDDEEGFSVDDTGTEFMEVIYETESIDAEAVAEERKDHYESLGFEVRIVKPGWM